MTTYVVNLQDEKINDCKNYKLIYRSGEYVQ